MFYNESDYIGKRVDTAYGYGEVIDVSVEQEDENPELVIILDSGDEIILPTDAIDVVDDDDGPEDDAELDDVEFDREEFADDFEED